MFRQILNFSFIFMLIYPSLAFSKKQNQSVKSLEKEVQSLKESLLETVKKNEEQGAVITKLKTEVDLVREKSENLAGTVGVVKSDQVSLKKHLDINDTITLIGTILILIGMCFEIIGAILLSIPSLAKKLTSVRKIEFKTPFTDLAIEATTNKRVVDMLIAFGSLILIIGFILQSVGISSILNIPLAWKIVLALIPAVIAAGVLYWVLSFDSSQTARERLKLIIAFIWYGIIKDTFGGNRELCDQCRGKVTEENAFVSFLFGKEEYQDVIEYQYGHKECLNIIFHNYANFRCHNEIQKAELEAELNLVPVQIFKAKSVVMIDERNKSKNQGNPSLKNYANFKKRIEKFSQS